VPCNLIPVQGSHVPLLKFQLAPSLKLLMSSGTKKKEPKHACPSEVKASHSKSMWDEVSSSTPHLLHKGILVSPIKWRSFLRVLCPARGPVTTMNCVLLKYKSLVFAPGLEPEINYRAYHWVWGPQTYICRGFFWNWCHNSDRRQYSGSLLRNMQVISLIFTRKPDYRVAGSPLLYTSHDITLLLDTSPQTDTQ